MFQKILELIIRKKYMIRMSSKIFSDDFNPINKSDILHIYKHLMN